MFNFRRRTKRNHCSKIKNCTDIILIIIELWQIVIKFTMRWKNFCSYSLFTVFNISFSSFILFVLRLNEIIYYFSLINYFRRIKLTHFVTSTSNSSGVIDARLNTWCVSILPFIFLCLFPIMSPRCFIWSYYLG